MDLADRLLVARTARNLSRRELSIRAGLSPAVAGQIERRDVLNPSMDTVRTLAQVLDVSMDWLSAGDGDGPAPAGAPEAA